MFIKPVNILLFTLLFCNLSVSAQKKATAKYPSLLWEITGNGLTKPSYLFGTMHVSNKMAFHLSDSFYLALKSVDAVALELNPDTWQGEMVKMNNIRENYTDFVRAPKGNYLTENSFRIDDYDTELKSAMSSEPVIVNSLLYRSYKAKEDFEEDTFLDLYIYQTGKKLGKRATGVENYFETEKIVMEAYADMAKEKKRKRNDTDGESRSDILEKTQDAYRRGDLDMMDSLDRMMDRSEAFTEKFLFKRNEIQANSMDTIMKKNSLFVGVGAAHLPGQRGVIELLRKMGYTLRPIIMTDRDAAQKEVVDKMKVPVNFTTQTADDGFFSVSMPGPLFKLSGEYQKLDRRQYSDMSNGSYYLVTRVKTHAAFLGQNEKDVLNKVDSILYENIPGKILSKKQISRNGYTGFDISNRTRRGDLQRYNIFITPFEVLFFKVGGKENYVDGAEAEQFFSSIKLKETGQAPVNFQPAHGEFSVKLPQQPSEYLNTTNSDMNDRWEYEAVDKSTGDAYVIFKKSLHNFRFLDEDNFELGLIEESFRNPEQYDKQISRELKNFKGYPALDVKEKQKDGSMVYARYIIRGPHYYVIAAKSKSKKADFSPYFNSFNFLPFKYNTAATYVDTFMHFTVNTPVSPQINDEMRQVTENAVNSNTATGYFSYWPKTKNGSFVSNVTGEMIGISIQEFPKYYYAKDSATFLADEMKTYFDNTGLLLYKTDTLNFKNDVKGFRFYLRDTGSSRTIKRMLMLKDNYTFSVVSLGDTLAEESSFIRSFYNSIAPEDKKLGRSIYENRLDEFIADLFSKDSATQKKAQQSISNIYFGEKGVQQIASAIDKLNLSDKDYFDSKVKLISELGYIKDTINPSVVVLLKKIFEKTTDTAAFQNEVFKALARHKTQKAYALFKELILQEPPVFSDSYEYSNMFRNLNDSLLLARSLFPELLQLSTLSDYKDQVLSLLVTLVDSNLIKAADYESYFTKIYFDAKVELKKLQIKDEKILEKELLKEDDDINRAKYTPNYSYSRYNKSDLDDYSVLLLPFYEKRKNVQLFFERLLQSREPEVRLAAAVLMLRNNIPVADTILTNLAADNLYRSKLYTKLEHAKRLGKFPAKYKDQFEMARSFLLADKNYTKVDSMVFIKKQPVAYLDKKGVVYFFKYRVNKEDDWKIGISGLQPEDEKSIYTDDKLTSMTDKKIKKDEPLDEQLQNQLKKILFSFHKSARNFYGYNTYSSYRAIDSYED
jgi:uncharacterized protein YbaP (TraB family)